MITRVRIWNKDAYGYVGGSKEKRAYIDVDGKEKGVYYIIGSKYNPSGSSTGLTDDEISEARKLSSTWTKSYYVDKKIAMPVQTKTAKWHCKNPGCTESYPCEECNDY